MHILVSIYWINNLTNVNSHFTLHRQLPPLQDNEPASDFYGKFSDRDRSNRRGSRDQRGFRSSRGWEGGQDSDDEFGQGGRSFRSGNKFRMGKSSGDDWLIGGSSRSSRFSSSNRL